MTTTLGFRNCNPGNLRWSSPPWQGAMYEDEHGFCVFDTMENGVRALARNLLAYQRHHDLHTIRGIISRWAPPSENETGAYIKNVAAAVNVGPDVDLDLNDTKTLLLLVGGIVRQENGQDLPADVVLAGVVLALRGAG